MLGLKIDTTDRLNILDTCSSDELLCIFEKCMYRAFLLDRKNDYRETIILEERLKKYIIKNKQSRFSQHKYETQYRVGSAIAYLFNDAGIGNRYNRSIEDEFFFSMFFITCFIHQRILYLMSYLFQRNMIDVG